MAIEIRPLSAPAAGPDRIDFNSHTEAPLVVFDLELDWARHRAWRAARPLRLSTLEFRLLRFLMLAPARIFSREEIIAAVWPSGIHVGLRTVDVHIASLRRALDAPPSPNPVRTVRGRGYTLDLESEPDQVGAKRRRRSRTGQAGLAIVPARPPNLRARMDLGIAAPEESAAASLRPAASHTA